MKMDLKTTLFQLIYPCVLTLFFATSCSRGLVGVSVHPTFNADTAIYILRKASNNQERSQALDRIKKSIPADFGWSKFWGEVLSRNILDQLEPDNRDKLFQLHSISCQIEHFQSFGEVARTHAHGLAYLLKPLKKCTTPLSPDALSAILSELNTQLVRQQDPIDLLENSTYLAELLTEESKLNQNLNWRELIGIFSAPTWQKVVESLLSEENPNSSLVISLVQFHLKKLGHVHFLNRTLDSIIKSPETFNLLLNKFRFSNLIQLFMSSSESIFLNLRQDQLNEFLDRLKQAFFSELLQNRGREPTEKEQVYSKLRLGWNLLMDLREIERKLSPVHSSVHALAWIEDLYRRYETELQRSNQPISEFLESLPSGYTHQSLDAMWFRLRIQRVMPSVAFPELASVPVLPVPASLTLLDRILTFRLNAYLHPTTASIQSFCGALDAAGIPSRRISVGNAADLAHLIEERGCTFVDGAVGPTRVELETPTVNMPFDSAIIAPDVSLDWVTTQIDGSLFDLSSALKHPDLPAESPLKEDAAITFPLIVGFQVNHPDFSRGQGTYYFVLHVIEKEAQPGRAALAKALKGYSGGSLRVRLRPGPGGADQAPRVNFFPILESQGGSGQRAVPARRGGDGDATDLDLATFIQFTRRWSLSRSAEASTASGDHFLDNPSIHDLRLLFESATRKSETDPTIQVFIKEDFSYLSPTQQAQKLNRVCPGINLDCIRARAEQALLALQEQIAAKDLLDHQILPQVKTRSFELPAGTLGPVNPDGPKGDLGSFSQNQEEIESE